MSAPEKIIGVVVTHKRRELLAESLKVLSTQSRPLDHLVVVDNADEADVKELVDNAPLPTSYIGSQHNLGGAGGFALGILYALSLGADRVWLADDDGRPDGPEVLETLLDCAIRNDLAEVSPSSATSTTPTALLSHCGAARRGAGAFRARRRGSPARHRVSLQRRTVHSRRDRCRRSSGSTPVRPRRRGRGTPSPRPLRPEVRYLPANCLCPPQRRGRVQADPRRSHAHAVPRQRHEALLHVPHRGYILSQPGMRKLLPQEWVRFGWYFLITRRDPAGLREWMRLRKLGRKRSSNVRVKSAAPS